MNFHSPDLGRLLDRAIDSICAFVLFGMLAVTAVDVAGRYLFNHPLPGGFEISELLLAVAIFAGFPGVSREGSHITVDLWTARLGPRGKRIQQMASDAVASLMCAALAVFMSQKTLDVAAQHDTTPYLNFPVAPVAGFMAASCALAALLFARRVFHDPGISQVVAAVHAEGQTWQ